MKRISPVVLYLLAAPCPLSFAQTERPLPSPPFIAAVPDVGQWVISYNYPQDRDNSAAAQDPNLFATQNRTVLYERIKNVTHSEIVNVAGKKIELWTLGRKQYAKGWDSSTWSESQGTPETLAVHFSDSDWITANDYVGTTKYLGHTCLVFAAGAPPNLDLSSPDGMQQLGTLTNVAFVDSVTKLPVEVRLGPAYEDYRFTDNPPESLTPPPDLQAALAKEAKFNDMLNRPAPPAVPAYNPTQ